jgi:hypothetical protein
MFEMQISLCDRFTDLNPLKLRREKAREVFNLLTRYNKYSRKKNKKTKNGKQIIRRPASDTWF